MLLQTNSYLVPKEKRTEHARLVKRFQALMAKLGCDDFQIYEQAGANWSTDAPAGRFVQILRFRDRDHQKSIRDAEAADAGAQSLVREFCELINFGYQHERGLALTAFYIQMGTSPGPAGKQPVNGTMPVPQGLETNGAAHGPLSDLEPAGPFRNAGAAPVRSAANDPDD